MRETSTAVTPPKAAGRRSPAAATGAARQAVPGATDERLRRTGSWRPWTALFISIAGLGVSIYLTLAHYDQSAVPLVCSEHGAINCAKVTTSSQSMVFGVLPVALLGLLFYAGMVALNLPAMWRSRWLFVARARLAGVVTGIGFVLYLLYVELFQIRAICIWCTTVHVLTYALFILVATGWADATIAARDPS